MGKKRMGRPTKPPTPGERVPLSLRVTAEIRERLEKAAVEKGRSLSQEAELRIERSFDREELLPEVLRLAYGKSVADVLVEGRPQLMKLDSSRLRRMIDPDLTASVYHQLKEHFGEALDTPVTLEPATRKRMREQLDKIFGDGDEETVGTPSQKGPRRIGAKEHRAKR
jgi:hypothetical protein